MFDEEIRPIPPQEEPPDEEEEEETYPYSYLSDYHQRIIQKDIDEHYYWYLGPRRHLYRIHKKSQEQPEPGWRKIVNE